MRGTCARCYLNPSVFFQSMCRHSVCHKLTKKPKPGLCGQLEAQEAFEALNRRLTSAPVLRMPDLEAQFISELDASNIGVGTVLSQLS